MTEQTARAAGSLPIVAYEGRVPGEWIDANGHVTSMAYPALFHPATGVLFSAVGIDKAYIETRKLSIFQREYHLSFERELLVGNDILIRSYPVDFDDKRMHHFHELWNVQSKVRAASVEYLSFHIDSATRRTAPFPEDVVSRLHALTDEFRSVPTPEGVGRRIAIRR